jgi:hypothetical protein
MRGRWNWELFKMYRDTDADRTLPWLNADRAQFIAVNRIPGDDVAVVLDYRLDASAPRVVGSHWPHGASHEWFEIAPDFDTFAIQLGLFTG